MLDVAISVRDDIKWAGGVDFRPQFQARGGGHCDLFDPVEYQFETGAVVNHRKLRVDGDSGNRDGAFGHGVQIEIDAAVATARIDELTEGIAVGITIGSRVVVEADPGVVSITR